MSKAIPEAKVEPVAEPIMVNGVEVNPLADLKAADIAGSLVEQDDGSVIYDGLQVAQSGYRIYIPIRFRSNGTLNAEAQTWVKNLCAEATKDGRTFHDGLIALLSQAMGVSLPTFTRGRKAKGVKVKLSTA